MFCLLGSFFRRRPCGSQRRHKKQGISRIPTPQVHCAACYVMRVLLIFSACVPHQRRRKKEKCSRNIMSFFSGFWKRGEKKGEFYFARRPCGSQRRRKKEKGSRNIMSFFSGFWKRGEQRGECYFVRPPWGSRPRNKNKVSPMLLWF